MVVQHNMNAINAYNRLNANVAGLKKASEKLSSGYRINRAGDDAAGLAISEKMRSQIRGLNQAVRNSQDGINMIQTFEGAAQETHSILQRMKELATESANGTYDNITDRAAIQLEFDQLNDELNQIADTDFNGTIVLNGGVMSDGLEVTRDTNDKGVGTFDYKTQFDANFEVDENGNVTAKGGNAVKDVVGNITGTEGKEAAHKILDNSKYDLDASKALWKEMGIDPADYDEVNITFVRDAEGAWKGALVTDKNGDVIKEAKANVAVTDMTNGGFKVDSAAVNAVFNNVEPTEGDYITLNFTAVGEKTYAPDNAGIDEVGGTGHPVDLNLKDGAGAAATTDDFTVTMPEFTLDAGITDDKMTADMKTALDELNAAKITATIQTTDGNGDGTDDQNSAVFTDADGKFTFTDNGDGTVEVKHTATDLVLGTLKGGLVAPKAETTTTFTKIAANMWAEDATPVTVAAGDIKMGAANMGAAFADGDVITVAADGTVTGTYGGATVAAADGYTSTLAAGTYTKSGVNVYKDVKTDAEVEAAGGDATAIAGANAGDTLDATTLADFEDGATFDFGINIDSYNFADGDVEAHAVATDALLTDDAMAALKAAGEKLGVSKSDAFQNSTAIMNYAEHIILQTGSRTKDAVDFTFNYNKADMGDLKANLNLSARADGLNTENLSLANADNANYAIDQIDKAINKTSMVRASFGAIQNRLEHKITNLTTTSENLTEAESNIRDTDMASEMMNYTKFNILQQAAQSMLAQANQQPQSILQLLG